MSAWCRENGIVLGQVATQSKSNEIKVIPELLDKLNDDHKIHGELDESHGRSVQGWVFVAKAPTGFIKMGWSKLSSIAAVKTISRKKPDQVVSVEWRYYITSRPLEDANIANYIRNYWSIENSLHWILDVHMVDDANRSQERNATLALAALKRVAVNIIKRHDKQNKSVRRKLKQASSDIRHLEILVLKTK